MGRISRRTVMILVGATALVVVGGCGDGEFSIEGTWKATGDESWGIVSKGSVVTFNGTNCNLFSPNDTYAFYEEGGEYHLDVTGVLGSGGSFEVTVVDDDNIELRQGSTTLVFVRVS